VPTPHNPTPVLPRPEDQPTLTVDHAAAVLGIGRSSAYAAIARGDIPALRIGSRVVVPTAALRRMLGIDLPTELAS
jgi:excisionase family DNA binding protein